MVVDMVPYLSNLDLVSLAAGLSILSVLFFLLAPFQRSSFPLINGQKTFEFSPANAKKRFLKDARNLIKSGLGKSSVFRVLSDNGIKTVLHPKYANDIRSHPGLSFGTAIQKEFHSEIPGFEPFKTGTSADQVFQYAVRTKLTQSLGNVTEPLSSETAMVLDKFWTNNTEWHDINLRTAVLGMVAQLSSRVFLGDKICRNPDWLRITVDYTVDSFVAAQELRLWPKPLRSFVANLLPSCRKIRDELQEAKDIITPVLEERRKAKEAVLREGRTPERYVDALQWMEESAQGRPYEPAVAQLSFSLAAIHTTSDMLTQVLLDLCGKDDLISELREEVITVIREEGWKKTTLYKLKLMDSVLKESQRLKPIGIATMRRYASEDIKLSDGTIIKKGSNLLVSNSRMWDPNVYADPETFDPYRFLKLRETPGHETSAQVASPSPDHMGFGFGKHACPGRFFAVNEVKIALCHILLKYDIRLPDGYTPKKRESGVSLNVDPFAKLSVRRRQEEISL
ncbi:cytochrome P450 [Aspergillus ambiguus]|uniref:cytochrome P450 n=1 Tax=Aspergillus ambiguus TaxID=176160 RepID=UPI003CCCF340